MFEFSKDLRSALVAANNKDEWEAAFKAGLQSGKHFDFGEKPMSFLGLRFESTKSSRNPSLYEAYHSDEFFDQWPYVHPSFRPHRSVFAMMAQFEGWNKQITPKRTDGGCLMPPIMPFDKSIFPGPSAPYKRTIPWGFIPTTPFGAGK
jgi:hypothetical protein